MFEALFLTTIVEAAVVLFWTRRPLGGVLLIVSTIEGITHPVSMYAYYFLQQPLICVELAVVVAEAALYAIMWRLRLPRELASMFLLSLTANVSSLFLSLRFLS